MQETIRSEKTSGFRWALYSVCLMALLLCFLNASSAIAQVDQGAIIGVVRDSSGAVMPGAQVSVTETNTGLVLKTKTNSSGNYFFSPIKTGNYTVSASAPGFETTEEIGIVVHVTDRLNIPLNLKPGKVTETVVVTSTAPLMQTQTAEVAMDIDSKFLNDAPLANRNWIFIAQEAPGVTPQVGRGAGNGDFSSNGQHAEQNNYQLDGVDNNTVNSDYINGSGYNWRPRPMRSPSSSSRPVTIARRLGAATPLCSTPPLNPAPTHSTAPYGSTCETRPSIRRFGTRPWARRLGIFT